MNAVDLPMPKCSCGSVMVRGDLSGIYCPECDTPGRASAIAVHPSHAPRFPQRVERRGPAGLPASRRAKNALVTAAFAGAAVYGWFVEPMWWAK